MTPLRRDLLLKLAHEIHVQPFQPVYRKTPIGKPVVGWGSRLNAYFWPDVDTDYSATTKLLDPWFSEAGELSRELCRHGAWSPAQRARASELALKMLDWGRTPQRDFSEQQVEAVFRKALDLPLKGTAPMNSGWSKVAAMATAYQENEPGGKPHVIWDSRVSTSLVTRLDRMMVEAGEKNRKEHFSRIGMVPGRGGSRKNLSPPHLKWAHAYQSWTSQQRGSELVRELRDILNEAYPAMPLPSGGSGPWTVRGVESVLFMDGY